MAPGENEAKLLELQIRDTIQKQRFQTPQAVHTVITLALRCLRETPTGLGQTPLTALTDPRLLQAVDVAERWLLGQATREEADDADEDAEVAATPLVGPGIQAVVGPGAAAWAAAMLAQAVSNAALIGYPGGDDKDNAQRAATSAIVSASLSRRAGKANDLEAVRFQLDFVRSIWPK